MKGPSLSEQLSDHLENRERHDFARQVDTEAADAERQRFEPLVKAAQKAVNLMGYLHWNSDPVGRKDKAEVYRELSDALALANKESESE